MPSLQLSSKIRRCTKCDAYFDTLHRYSRICYGCKGNKTFFLAHCPACNFLQISTAISRFVCKNCRHSPLPKNAKVIYQATDVKEVIRQMNQLKKIEKQESPLTESQKGINESKEIAATKGD